MKKYLSTAALVCLLGTPAYAQTAVSNAAGTGIANSRSTAGALAISGQGGAGGNSNATGGAGGNANALGGSANARGGNVTINSNVPPVQTVNSNSNVSGTTTSNVNSTVSGSTTTHVVSSGSSSVKTNAAVFAPGLSAAGLETCLGSASGGVSVVGFGLTGGSSYPDEGCQARLDSRTLWAMGLKKAALARLCQRDQIYRSMPDICTEYLPVPVTPVGYPAPVAGSYVGNGYGDGVIMVVEGKTGRERPCAVYEAAKQRCKSWADASRPQPKIKIAARAPSPRRQPATAVTPNPAAVAAAPPPAPENR
jgi:hypothetical protein